jgi:hypothetical protein
MERSHKSQLSAFIHECTPLVKVLESEKKVNEVARLLALDLIKSWIRQIYRIAANAQTLEQAFIGSQAWLLHKMDIHFFCLAEDGEVKCQSPSWRDSKRRNLLILDQPAVVLTARIYSAWLKRKETFELINDCWLNGSTSFNESWHSVKNQCLPKHIYVGYKKWMHLLAASALEYNESRRRLVVKSYPWHSSNGLHKNKHQSEVKENNEYEWMQEVRDAALAFRLEASAGTSSKSLSSLD